MAAGSSRAAAQNAEEPAWLQTVQDKMDAARAEVEQLIAAVDMVRLQLQQEQLSQYDDVRQQAAKLTPASEPPAAFQTNWLWLIDPPSDGYSAPKLTEVLPEFLLSDAAKAFMVRNNVTYYNWSTTDVIKWSMNMSISRKLMDHSTQVVTGFNSDSEALPFKALWDDDVEASAVGGDGLDATAVAYPDLAAHASHTNALQPDWVPWLGDARVYTPGRGWFYPWLGCRCSWPCTQLCWWQMMSCGLYQYVAIAWSVTTIAFELTVLDAIVVDDFIAKVPDRIVTWSDYAYLNTSVASRVATLFVYFVFPWIVAGFVFSPSLSPFGNLHAYYNGELPGVARGARAGVQGARPGGGIQHVVPFWQTSIRTIMVSLPKVLGERGPPTYRRLSGVIPAIRDLSIAHPIAIDGCTRRIQQLRILRHVILGCHRRASYGHYPSLPAILGASDYSAGVRGELDQHLRGVPRLPVHSPISGVRIVLRGVPVLPAAGYDC